MRDNSHKFITPTVFNFNSATDGVSSPPIIHLAPPSQGHRENSDPSAILSKYFREISREGFRRSQKYEKTMDSSIELNIRQQSAQRSRTRSSTQLPEYHTESPVMYPISKVAGSNMRDPAPPPPHPGGSAVCLSCNCQDEPKKASSLSSSKTFLKPDHFWQTSIENHGSYAGGYSFFHDTIRAMEYRAFQRWYQGAHTKAWSRPTTAMLCTFLAGGVVLLMRILTCPSFMVNRLQILLHIVAIISLGLILAFGQNRHFVSRWSVGISVLFLSFGIILAFANLANSSRWPNVASLQEKSNEIQSINFKSSSEYATPTRQGGEMCTYGLFASYSFYVAQAIVCIIGFFYSFCLNRLARWYYLKSRIFVSRWRLIACHSVRLLVPALGQSDKQRYERLMNPSYAQKFEMKPPLDHSDQGYESDNGKGRNDHQSDEVDQQKDEFGNQKDETEQKMLIHGKDRLRICKGMRIQCVKKSFSKSLFPQWLLKCCHRYQNRKQIKVGIWRRKKPKFGGSQWDSGVFGNTTATFIGETDSTGKPDGFGFWKEDRYLFGENLVGYWSKGVPDGPYKSRELGSGSGFMCIRIGWASYNLNDDKLQFGVANIECSVSGKFYRGFPAVHLLHPPNHNHDKFLCPSNFIKRSLTAIPRIRTYKTTSRPGEQWDSPSSQTRHLQSSKTQFAPTPPPHQYEEKVVASFHTVTRLRNEGIHGSVASDFDENSNHSSLKGFYKPSEVCNSSSIEPLEKLESVMSKKRSQSQLQPPLRNFRPNRSRSASLTQNRWLTGSIIETESDGGVSRRNTAMDDVHAAARALKKLGRGALNVPHQIKVRGAAAAGAGVAAFRKLRRREIEKIARLEKSRRDVAWCLAQISPHTPNFGIQPRSELVISVDSERGLYISGWIPLNEVYREPPPSYKQHYPVSFELKNPENPTSESQSCKRSPEGHCKIDVEKDLSETVSDASEDTIRSLPCKNLSPLKLNKKQALQSPSTQQQRSIGLNFSSSKSFSHMLQVNENNSLSKELDTAANFTPFYRQPTIENETSEKSCSDIQIRIIRRRLMTKEALPTFLPEDKTITNIVAQSKSHECSCICHHDSRTSNNSLSLRGDSRADTEDNVYGPDLISDRMNPLQSRITIESPELQAEGWMCMDDAGSPEVLLYIHGYNNSLEEILGQMAAFGNFPNHIRIILFSWPAGKCFLDFFKARKSAEDAKTHKAFADFLVALRDNGRSIKQKFSFTGIRQIHIMCHSMGSRLFLKSFRKTAELLFQEVDKEDGSHASDGSVKKLIGMLQIVSVTFLNPEYYLEEFVEEDYGRLRRYCNHITIFADAKDQALWWSETISRRLALGKTVFGLWQSKTSGTVSLDYLKQPPQYLNTISFFRYSSYSSRKGLRTIDARDESNEDILDWLGMLLKKANLIIDLDVIDTTFMDQNVHAMRHSYWNLNREIIEDIRESLVTRKRARQRTGRLDRRDGNVWVYRVAPSFLTSLFDVYK